MVEPKNHPIEKKKHLPKAPFLGSMLIFEGIQIFALSNNVEFVLRYIAT